jgi:hypothetical protein
MTTQLGLETVRTILEREMLFLSSDQTELEHKLYLAGLIDGYYLCGRITQDTRNVLYSEYAF